MNYLKDIRRLVDRRTLIVLVCSSLIISVLEVLSVSAAIPALNLLLNGSPPAGLAHLLGLVGIDSPAVQKLVIVLLIVLVFLIRASILSYILYFQSGIVFKLQARFSWILYDAYLKARFEVAGKLSSATITRTTTTELSNLTVGVLLPLTTLISELALVIGAAMVLVAVQPVAAVFLIILTVVLAAPVLALNSRKLSRFGVTRHQMEHDRTRLAQEITGGIREIKVYGFETQLLESIQSTNTTYGSVMTRINFLQNFPRVYFETAGLSVLLIICGVQLYRGVPSAEILTFLMIAGFAAFRALPSVAKILSQLQALRFYRPSLTNYLELLDELRRDCPASGAAHAQSDPVADPKHGVAQSISISVDDATYSYPNVANAVFKHATFELLPGQIVALTGPSGIGKSTLLDCILGLRELNAGSVSVLGSQGHAAAAKVAYVPQSPVVFDGTIWRNLTLAQQESAEVPAVDAAMAKALSISGLGDFMHSHSLSLQSKITESGRNLSGGQRQRLALARALLRRGNLVVLDEATSALDELSERNIFQSLRESLTDTIVIIVTHNPKLQQFCDQIIEIEPGGIVKAMSTPQHRATDEQVD
jgi:ABC-type multidrug transport system fused ATPase/permease subunit